MGRVLGRPQARNSRVDTALCLPRCEERAGTETQEQSPLGRAALRRAVTIRLKGTARNVMSYLCLLPVPLPPLPALNPARNQSCPLMQGVRPASVLAGAAMPKYQKTECLPSNRNLFLGVLVAGRHRSAWLSFGELSSSGLHTACSSPCPHMAEEESSGLFFPLWCPETHHGRPTLMTPPTAPLQVPSLWVWGFNVGALGHKLSVRNSLPEQGAKQAVDHCILPVVLVFSGCCNKYPCSGWLNATETHSLTVLVARSSNSRSSNSRCGQGHSSLGAPGGILPGLSQLPVAPGTPWLVSASLQSLSASSQHLFCVCVCVSQCLS